MTTGSVPTEGPTAVGTAASGAGSGPGCSGPAGPGDANASLRTVGTASPPSRGADATVGARGGGLPETTTVFATAGGLPAGVRRLGADAEPTTSTDAVILPEV